jgi:hypothetical protein
VVPGDDSGCCRLLELPAEQWDGDLELADNVEHSAPTSGRQLRRRLETDRPSAEPFPQATSSFTVTVGPVNLAADSGAGKVLEVFVIEPSTEAL